MKVIASREFQLNYQRLDEPVKVMARSRTLGTWYPKGTEPTPSASAAPPTDAAEQDVDAPTKAAAASGAPSAAPKGGSTAAYKRYAASLKR